MKFFRKTKIIAMLLAIIIVFNFIVPTNAVHAAGLGDLIANALKGMFESFLKPILDPILESFGGFVVKLVIDGVVSLLDTLVDGIAVIVNNLFVDDGLEAVIGDNSKKILLTPDNIILGRFLLLNGNIFQDTSTASPYNPSTDTGYVDLNKTGSGRTTLRETVAGWYYALRNFSIVALLSVLVYVAIRMVISTASTDKAKYKMMLKDWLVAICLVIFMHYIMVALLEISTLITDAVGKNSGLSSVDTIRVQIDDAIDKMKELKDPTNHSVGVSNITGVYVDPTTGEVTSYMSLVGEAISNIFLYVALIVFTIIFTVKYLLRAITIMFLAIIRTSYSNYIPDR